MAIELECGICGQEHRFREEHAGRQSRCKECSARIDIPRGGLGGIFDGTTPVFTPPVIFIGSFLLVAVIAIGIGELIAAFQPNGATTANAAGANSAQPPNPQAQGTVPLVGAPGAPGLPRQFVPQNANQPPSTTGIATNGTGQPAAVLDGQPQPPSLPSIPPPRESPRNRMSLVQISELREQLARRGTPLVSFYTREDQPIQISRISPSWAEPGEEVLLWGRGFKPVTRAIAIDNDRFQEHELSFRVISDTEISVKAPPMIERRDESLFVFELHTPDGIAVTFPIELIEASKNAVIHEFAIVRREQCLSVVKSFVLLDELGSAKMLTVARAYTLKPTEVLSIQGAESQIVLTPEVRTGTIFGANIVSKKVPAVFPSFLHQLFIGPKCRMDRVRIPEVDR